MKHEAVYICAAKRTPIGSFHGTLQSLSAPELAAVCIKSALSQSSLDPSLVDEVILGCVLTSGIGQAPARQAAMLAGLRKEAQALTINKVCSSGLKAIILGYQNIRLGLSRCVVAGGMESMSQVPYLLPAMRSGAKLGHAQCVDGIVKDGLWDVYNDFHMGNAAELCAREYKLTREQQDNFAIESYSRAQQAIAQGYFKDEIAPVAVEQGKNQTLVSVDEEPGKAKLDKIPLLKPVFEKSGTVTAANASSINDGAASVVLCSEGFAKEHKLEPLAKIVEQGWASQAPEWFTTAPIAAVNHLLSRSGYTMEQVDLFEINEAFAAVSLACCQGLNLPAEKVNTNGGAVALGHPIGASGARILVTLIYLLRRLAKHRGVAAICNGGGEATALMIEAK